MLNMQAAAEQRKKGAFIMIDNQTVGKTIAALRQQADLSQQALANLCNVTHQAVSKWEKGLALPDMQTMLFLSKYFSVSMEDILTGNVPAAADMKKAQERDGQMPDEILADIDADIGAEIEAGIAAEIEESIAAGIKENIADEIKAGIAAGFEAEKEADHTARKENAEETAGEKEGIPSMDWQEIIHLAPFASRATLDQLVLANLENGEKADWKLISNLLPFVSRSTVDGLMDRCLDTPLDWNHARCVLPFAGREKIEQIFSCFLKNMDVQKLTEVAPFVSGKFMAQAIREMGDSVDVDLALKRLLPFLPTEMVDELILRKAGKQPRKTQMQQLPSWGEILDRAPMADENELSRLILDKINQDGVEEMDWPMATILIPFANHDALCRLANAMIKAGKNAQEGTQMGFEPYFQMETEKRKAPRKERALMRIARKAVEEGNEEWLEEHGEDLTSEELDEIIPLAAEAGMWDALAEIWKHTDGETLQKLIRKAVEQEQWDLLEEMAEHAEDGTLQYITQAAASAHQWELLEELQAHLDDSSLSAAARSAAENQQWDLLEEMLDRLDQETLQFVLDAAMQASNWDIIDAISELME